MAMMITMIMMMMMTMNQMRWPYDSFFLPKIEEVIFCNFLFKEFNEEPL